MIFKKQVDDFAIAAPNELTANILFDMIDDKLTIPMKRQGFLDMYNGIDVIQTCHYIKILCTSYINKICKNTYRHGCAISLARTIDPLRYHRIQLG